MVEYARKSKSYYKTILEINHIDHKHDNNRLDNLEYVTKVENSQAYRDSDKFQKYMQQHGQQN